MLQIHLILTLQSKMKMALLPKLEGNYSPLHQLLEMAVISSCRKNVGLLSYMSEN